MSNADRQYETTVDVGRPSSSGERWKSAKILFHRFADLPSAVGQRTRSSRFTCNGFQWRFKVYPGGHSEARTGKLSLYLELRSKESTTASFEARVLDKSQEIQFAKVVDDHNFASDDKTWGWKDFCDRSNILDNCLDDDGTLAIVVAIKNDSASPFVPSNPISGMISGMFLDEETADVCFQVSSEDHDKAASSTVTFHAHSFILKACAPMLASLFDSDDEKITTVSITDVEPFIFRHLLHYVYGGILPGR